MTGPAKDLKDKIIETVIPDVVFDGWTLDVVYAAAEKNNMDKAAVKALFPLGMSDVLSHYASYIDDQMLRSLDSLHPEDMRVRDRIEAAVMARISIVAQNEDVEKQAMSYWSLPTRSLRASRILWRSADCIWVWAGDTATDYNRYTKRGLLSGVIASTMLFWANQTEYDEENIRSFVGRRIENVMQLGGILGRMKKAS